MGSCRNGGASTFFTEESSKARTCARELSKNDGVAAEISGKRWHVAATHRSSGVLARDLFNRHVYFCNGHWRKERMARQEDLCAGREKSMAGVGHLPRAER